MDAATFEGERDVCEPRLLDLDAAITRPGSNRHRHPVALRSGGQGEPVGKKVPILGDHHQKRSGGGSHESLGGLTRATNATRTSFAPADESYVPRPRMASLRGG